MKNNVQTPRDFLGSYLLIAFGILFFLDRQNLLRSGYLGELLKLWPLLLIFIGFEILSHSRKIYSTFFHLFAITCLSLIILLGLKSFPFKGFNNSFGLRTQSRSHLYSFSETDIDSDYDDTNLKFDLPLAKLNLSQKELDSNILEIQSYSVSQTQNLFHTLEVNSLNINFRANHQFKLDQPEYQVKLNQSFPLDKLDLNLGAGSANLRFSHSAPHTITTKLNFGSLDLNISNQATPSAFINLDINFGNTIVTLPPNTPIKINYQINFGRLSVDNQSYTGKGQLNLNTNSSHPPSEIHLQSDFGNAQIDFSE